MKKTLIAFAVLGAFAANASAQSSVSVYGIIDAGMVYTTNQTATGSSKSAIESSQMAVSRWGFKGTEDLGGGLKANFNLEGTLANDTGAAGSSYGGDGKPDPKTGGLFSATGTSATLFDRNATVGLSGNFGTINFGRQNMVGADSIGLADPLSLAHAATNPNIAYAGLNSSALYGNFGTNGGGTALRQNNSVKYLTPMVSGFGGAAMYGFGEQAGNPSANSYAGLSAYFTDGSSGAAFAYAKLKDVTGNSTLTLLGGGGKLKLDSAALKLTYAQNEVDGGIYNNRKIAIIGAGVDYFLNPMTTLTAAYYDTKLSGLGSGKADQYIAMGKYALSKRSTLYASFTYVKAASNSFGDTLVSGGLVPYFPDATGAPKAGAPDTANRLALGVNHTF
jgi:predicted porin